MTGSSSFLPVSVRGIAGTATIVVGHVARRERGRAARSAMRARSSSSSSTPVAQDDEQEQLVGSLEVDDQAVEHLVELLDDDVELARAEPDAAAVERRVGAARDHRAAVAR